MARKLLDSEIFFKPAAWFKIWMYILLKVNHRKRGAFSRGCGFFNWEYEKHFLPGITKHQWYSCLTWLEQAKQITKKKTMRGLIITASNYGDYQFIKAYKTETETETETENEPRTDRERTETIHNNDNNGKNGKGGSMKNTKLYNNGQFDKKTYEQYVKDTALLRELRDDYELSIKTVKRLIKDYFYWLTTQPLVRKGCMIRNHINGIRTFCRKELQMVEESEMRGHKKRKNG